MNKDDVQAWLAAHGWHENPFIFAIMPEIFVGYKEQKDKIMVFLQERHKFCLVFGPTGSGKTTFMRWAAANTPDKFQSLYIAKPPEHPDEFVDIFNERFKKPWYVFWQRNIKNLYQIPEFLGKKLKGKSLVVLLDEAHEAPKETLEWLRSIADQVSAMTVILSGLPVLESVLSGQLETLRKRVAARIELLSLTKEETAELIEKRIQHAAGRGDEFSQLIDYIYEQTGGFPREVIRLCDEIVNRAISKNTEITNELIEKNAAPEKPAMLGFLDALTPMQRSILEMLSKESMSPGQLADSLDLSKYKSRQHAVRSINNILKLLMKEAYVERSKSEKAFLYALVPRMRTMLVKA